MFQKLEAFATADLHLTDNPLDAYRWRFLDWLERYLRNKPCKLLFILGDLTDKKDRHSGEFINRLVDRLIRLRMEARLERIVILKGNHDYSHPLHPTMGFLNNCNGITFISAHYLLRRSGGCKDVLFLAHQQREDAFQHSKFEGLGLVLMHQSVRGVELSNGASLNTGVRARVFSGVDGPVVSGDIHVPQTIGNVTYTGSPYPVKFGDYFSPRILRLYQERQDGEVLLESHPVPSISRTFLDLRSLDDLARYYIAPGDQVKVRYYCGAGGKIEWDNVKEKAEGFVRDHGAEVVSSELYRDTEHFRNDTARGGVAPARTSKHALIEQHGESSNLDDYLVEAGKEFLR